MGDSAAGACTATGYSQLAEFKIYLPRINEAVKRAEGDAAQTELPQGSEPIPLVEDELMVRNIARATLELNGYKVMAAANGREALSVSEPYGKRIHLLLTDVGFAAERNGLQCVVGARAAHVVPGDAVQLCVDEWREAFELGLVAGAPRD